MRQTQAAPLVVLMLLAAVTPLPELVVREYLVHWAGLYLLGLVASLLLLRSFRQHPLQVPALPLAAGILLLSGFGLGLSAAMMPMTAALGALQRLATMMLVIPVMLLAGEAWGRRQIARYGTLTLAYLILGVLLELLRQGRLALPLEGAVDHGNVVAYLTIVLLPLAWQTSRRDPDRVWRRFALAISLVALVQLAGTLSAGALLGLAAAVIAGGARLQVRWQRRAALIMLVGGAVIVAVTLLVLGHEISVSGRVILIRSGWRAILEHPITGQGVYGFLSSLGPLRPDYWWQWPIVCRNEPLNHVHLEPLHTWVEGGLFALVGLVLLTLWAVIVAMRPTGDTEESGWVRTLRRMTAAAIVQGAVTLAPAREGIVAVVLIIGLLAARPVTGRQTKMPCALTAILTILLLSGIPLQWANLRGQWYYGLGRTPGHYAVRDLPALERAFKVWPEQVEARSLFAWSQFDTAMTKQEGSQERSKHLDRALREVDAVDRYAPQFNRTSILRAEVLKAKEQYREALRVLEADTLFIYDWGWQALHQDIFHKLYPDSTDPYHRNNSDQ